MNRNIEVINNDLWAVNMGYVSAGFIRELNLYQGKHLEHNHITLTKQGTLIIDKASPLYPVMKQLLLKIRKKKTDEIRKTMYKYSHSKMDALDDLIFNLYGWELKRRSVKKQWLIEHTEPRLKIIERIKQYGKKVMKCLRFKQEYN